MCNAANIVMAASKGNIIRGWCDPPDLNTTEGLMIKLHSKIKQGCIRPSALAGEELRRIHQPKATGTDLSSMIIWMSIHSCFFFFFPEAPFEEEDSLCTTEALLKKEEKKDCLKDEPSWAATSVSVLPVLNLLPVDKDGSVVDNLTSLNPSSCQIETWLNQQARLALLVFGAKYWKTVKIFCCVQMFRQQGSRFFLQGEDAFHASGPKKRLFNVAIRNFHSLSLSLMHTHTHTAFTLL